MNHSTTLTDLESIYDAVQMGEFPGIKMGDTINGQYLMINGHHLEPMQDGVTYFRFTEIVKNHSTRETFVEEYIATEVCPISATSKHLETLTSPAGVTYFTATDAQGNRVYSHDVSFEDYWNQEDEEAFFSGSTPAKASNGLPA